MGTNGALTFEVNGATYPLKVDRLDFATREELADAYIANRSAVRKVVYAYTAAVTLAGGGLGLTLPAYDMDPIAYGRAAYSALRAAGVDREELITTGALVVVAVIKGLFPTDTEVADRQDFTPAGGSSTDGRS